MLELYEKLRKWICRAIGPSTAASLEPLVHQLDLMAGLFISML